MPVIHVQTMPGLPRSTGEVPAGTNFYHWLEKSTVPADCVIHINGKQVMDGDELSFPLKSGDVVNIYCQPKGAVGDLIGAILKPVQQVLSFLLPSSSPAVSGSGYTVESPNNSLKSQTNVARNGEARPDNYGQIRSFPDLIQESLFEYIDDLKYVTEFMDFGVGKYDVSSVRYAETNLGSLAGASYVIYQPGQVIPEIIEPYQFDGLDGQEVPGLNESTDIPAEQATTGTVISGQYSGGVLRMVVPETTDFEYFNGLSFPHSVTFTVNVTYSTPSGTVTENLTLSGDIASSDEVSDGGLPPTYYYGFNIVNISGNNSAYLTNATINNNYFQLTDNQALVVGPYVAAVESSQIWVHIISELGPTSGTANYLIKYWAVDDNGNQIPGTQQQLADVVDNPYNVTTKTYYRTYKFAPAYGFAKYAISVERTNNSNSGNRVTLEAAHAINIRSNVVYPDDTLVKVRVKATLRPTSATERKYNALITRYTIGYDLATGTVRTTLLPSRSFADSAAHMWLVTGEQPRETIDLDKLYDIAESLPDPRLGYFDFTFDDEDIALGERMQKICDAASVICFWDDGVLSFARDEKRPYPSTVFNTRNMSADGYKISYDMTLPGSYDGIDLQYRDPDTNKQAHVYYRISSSSNTIEEGEPSKAKKFDLLYIRNRYQAVDRAIKECRRLMFSRRTMEIKALSDAEWVNVGEMIQVVDIYDKMQKSGIIRSRSGNVFTTNEVLKFEENLKVVITDSMGNVSDRLDASPVPGNPRAFQAALPDNFELNIIDYKDVNSASRFMLSSETEMDTSYWVITQKDPGKPNGNNEVNTTMTLTEYNDEMYNYTVTE